MGGKRFAERAKLCHQPVAEIPDWPAGDMEAYAIRLLGVITEDRTSLGIERECVADL